MDDQQFHNLPERQAYNHAMACFRAARRLREKRDKTKGPERPAIERKAYHAGLVANTTWPLLLDRAGTDTVTRITYADALHQKYGEKHGHNRT